MFRRLAKDIKIKNAIQGIDEMLDEIDEIKIDFQDSLDMPTSEALFEYNNLFKTQGSSIAQALKAIKEAEKQLNEAKTLFMKNMK